MLTSKKTTWILVCDGARGRVLVNGGRGTGLDQIENAEHEESREPTRALGTDRPGRSSNSSGTGRHAFSSPIDWHQFEKEQFAKEMADIINRGAVDNQFDQLVLVAPPRVLGDLRQALNAHALGKTTGELGKDLTNVAVHDLGDHLDDLVNL